MDVAKLSIHSFYDCSFNIIKQHLSAVSFIYAVYEAIE